MIKMRNLRYVPEQTKGYSVNVVFKSTPFNRMKSGLEQFASIGDFMSRYIKQAILGYNIPV